MSSTQQEPQTPDLALLKDMVGVQKELKALVGRKQPLDRAAVLGVLEAERKSYAANGLFIKKEMALQEIIAALQKGAVTADAVIKAAGADTASSKPDQGGGFSLGRLFGRARS